MQINTMLNLTRHKFKVAHRWQISHCYVHIKIIQNLQLRV
jgi:hypothetical protein